MALPLTLALLGGTVLCTPLLTRLLGRRAGWPLAGLYLLAAALLVPAAGAVLDGRVVEWSRPWHGPVEASFALRADGLGIVFAAIALLVGAVVLAYSTAYLGEGRQTSFYVLMAAFTFAMVGLVLADDLVLLFICWELTSLASAFLIARSGDSGHAPSMRTMLITFVGGLFLLAAVGAMVVRLGTTSLTEVLASDVWRTDHSFAALVAVLVALAAFTKSAQVPFHTWLPDAMAAITPVSAYLHAAAVVKAGIFLMLRFSPAFHDVPVWNALLISAGLTTAIVGGFAATRQADLKKLMACSTVSQLGFITAAIGVGTDLALAAAVLHTIAHALFKAGLFMMVGVVDHAAGTREIAAMPRLVRAMPGSFVVTVLGCASMAGIPPMLGFVSKEKVLTALGETPGAEAFGYLALAAGAAGAVLTVLYCGRIVLGSFVDGTGEQEPQAVSSVMVWTTALPIVAGLPLALVVGVLDPVVSAASAAAGATTEAHLALWHGVTLELVVTLAVLAVGGALVAARRRLSGFFDGRRLTPDGATVLGAMSEGARRLGDRVAAPTRADYPSRHVAPMLVSLSLLLLGGAVVVRSDLAEAPLTADLSRPYDLVVLLLVAVATIGVATTRSRLAATMCLGGVGIVATGQIMALGAPDVGLTQLLVECLTVIVIMLVLQKLPRTFAAHRSHGDGALVRRVVIALSTGAAVGVGTWALTSRRPRSEIADYYLANGPEITGGDNIVNTILVEFRALDTLGELAVLGMAGVAVVAILSSVRDDQIDPPPERNPHYEQPAEVPLRGPGSVAHRAIHEAWPNTVAMQLMLRGLAPVLAGLSAYILWRGHNAPGGGFIAALIASAIVGLMYLSTSRDRQIGPPRLPLVLIGGGVLTAVLTGVWGLVAKGEFLEPLHGYLWGQHLSSALVFDIGVYLAVLGLVVVTFNLLGTSESASPGAEGTRERADETHEGELAGPLDTVRGEPASEAGRVGPRTRHVSEGTPPREVGR